MVATRKLDGDENIQASAHRKAKILFKKERRTVYQERARNLFYRTIYFEREEFQMMIDAGYERLAQELLIRLDSRVESGPRKW